MPLSDQAHSARRVAITAFGVVSPLGLGATENLTSLQAGRDAVLPVTSFDVSRCRAKTAGQIPNLPAAPEKVYRPSVWHRSSLMVAAAMTEAKDGDPAFTPELVVVGTTSGGMSNGEAFHRAQIGHRHPPERAAWLANYMPQKAVLDGLLASDWSAPMQIIANACASGTNAIGHAFRLIRGGQHTRILCGGYDAISELVFVGFDSLQASTPEKVRPFDRDRTGLVLGEGAAMFCLEDWNTAVTRDAPICGEVTGYGIATDNHHLTQPHPSGIGPRQAMSRALADARREPGDIDYINAHGTATTFNDATEAAAITELFGPGAVPVSSTKSMMGHSLGAAGAIEASFSLLALRHGFLPPNINFIHADPGCRLEIVANQAREADVRRVVSNSFGFGGTNASLVLEAL
ncbi:MAG: beta-ketoacyl-[acyl-carrier-protein] synthase family protein [Chthoniobacteraceae bacterium]